MAFLRQVSRKGEAQEKLLERRLLETEEAVLGRDLSNQVVIDYRLYGMVSRRHAIIRSQERKTKSQTLKWEICDLKSANGTYVNGRQLQGCQRLEAGDRITLGQNGPDFIFEEAATRQPKYPAPSIPAPPKVSAVSSLPNSEKDSLTLTQLFPIVSTGRQLVQKAYLYPAILTVVCVVLMFLTIGKPTAFNLLTAVYIAGGAYYFVYQLCGKRKPWWVLFGAAFATGAILLSPLLSIFISIFREVLPGNISADSQEVGFLNLLVGMFFGAGLMEELLKALPVFAALLLGRCLRSPWREKIGVWEPLDGILLATASAVGFTMLETLGQYVPNVIYNASLQSGIDAAGQLVGLQLLIPRILGSVSGHLAYSGYFGYFIGLSVLKPKSSWLILGIGYLTSAALHALWNAVGDVNVFILAFVGAISYAFLAAAILKARALSPTRSQNFATRLK